MIIGLGHYARTGKDALADILVSDHGFTRVAFADTLRAFVYETNPIVAMLVDRFGWDEAKERCPVNVRQPLVDVGIAARRHLGEDVWIRAVQSGLRPEVDYVIPDLRYPNEADWIGRLPGVTVKVTRLGVCPLENVADQALAGFDDWDFTVANDGTLDDLAVKAADLVGNIRQRKAGR